MKTLYSHRRNNTRKILAGGVAAVVFLIVFAVRAFAPNFFFALTTPLMAAGGSVTASVGNSVSGLTNASALASQNQALEEEVLALKNQNQALTARTQDLTKLLGSSDTSANEGQIIAGVLARPPESPYDTLLVAAGSTDGVKTGDEVFVQGGVPIGTIAHVSNDSSQVSLFSTAGLTQSGWIGENRVPISLTGAGAGAFNVSLAKDAIVSAGDLVYLPGPGAVPMGTVSQIDTDPSSPIKLIHVQPSVNIFSVTWVAIGHPAS